MGCAKKVTLLGMSLGKKCILVDDILNTGQTLATAAEVLMKKMVRKKCMLAPRMVCYQKAQKATLEKCAN